MIITRSRLYRDLPIAIYFICLATVIDYFTSKNINYLFITFSVLGIITLVTFHFKAVPKPGNEFLILTYLFMIAVSLWNYSTSRWTSLVYSGFFVITFIVYVSFIQQYVGITQFRRLLKIVFYLYFVGLLAGQLDVYLNLFSPVWGIIGFMRGTFGTMLEKDGLRFFSFSSEPSYAAFIVTAIYYVYLKLNPTRTAFLQGENLLLFLILLYMIYMFKSAYGMVLVGLLVVDQVGFSTTLVWMVLVVAGALTFAIINEYDIRALNRVLLVIEKIELNDLHSLFSIDFTAYYRVAPVLHYIETADWTDLHFLLGHGAGSSRLFVVPEIYEGYIGGEFLGGFAPGFFYDYGVIGGLMVVFFVFRRTPSFFSFPTAAIGLMLLNANFNTQLFWFLIFCFSMNKHFSKQAKREAVVVKPLAWGGLP